MPVRPAASLIRTVCGKGFFEPIEAKFPRRPSKRTLRTNERGRVPSCILGLIKIVASFSQLFTGHHRSREEEGLRLKSTGVRSFYLLSQYEITLLFALKFNGNLLLMSERMNTLEHMRD